jgi:hypothetical protein
MFTVVYEIPAMNAQLESVRHTRTWPVFEAALAFVERVQRNGWRIIMVSCDPHAEMI